MTSRERIVMKYSSRRSAFTRLRDMASSRDLEKDVLEVGLADVEARNRDAEVGDVGDDPRYGVLVGSDDDFEVTREAIGMLLGVEVLPDAFKVAFEGHLDLRFGGLAYQISGS